MIFPQRFHMIILNSIGHFFRIMSETDNNHGTKGVNPTQSGLNNSNQFEDQISHRMFGKEDYWMQQGKKNKNTRKSISLQNSMQLNLFQNAMQKRLKQKENKKKGSKFGAQIQKKKTAISNFRQRNLLREFISRLTRNSVYRKPIQFEQYSLKCVDSQHGRKGIMVSENLSNFLEFLKILSTILSVLAGSFIVPFYQSFKTTPFYSTYSYFGCVFTAFEILIGFTLINKQEQNKRTLSQISKSYLRGNFILDFIYFLVFFICAVSPHNFSPLYLIFLMKIPSCVRKINKIETQIANTYAMQSYVKLLKLISWNFTFAHFIAVIMLLMSNFDATENWIVKCHFDDKYWLEQYSWAYYWAMTTMLSVGFGDIAVANYKQALVLTIIEAFGCVIIGYNVSSVIGLINSLEEKQTQRNRNINLLKKIKEKNQIQTGIYKEITSFIKQSDEVDEKFNREPLANLLQKLPQNLQNGFLRSVNEKSLKHLPFFRHLHSKSLSLIAEKIYTKVAHPEQILIEREQICNKILILKEGAIGIFPWFFGLSSLQSSKFQQFDKFVVREGGESKILNLNFLRPFYKTQNYQYRPIKYSLLLQTSLSELRQIIKPESTDFEMYFQYRDKDCGALSEYEVMSCQICRYEEKNRYQHPTNELQRQRPVQCWERHMKINCPRLHYNPIRQQVINKYLRVMKTNKVARKKFCSLKLLPKERLSGLKYYKKIFQEAKQLADVQSVQIEFSKNCVAFQLSQGMTIASSQIPKNIINYCLENKESEKMELNGAGGFFQKESTIRKKVVQVLPAFWNLECDRAYDFKYYFTRSNPKKLCRESSTCYISNKRCSFLTTFI